MFSLGVIISMSVCAFLGDLLLLLFGFPYAVLLLCLVVSASELLLCVFVFFTVFVLWLVDWFSGMYY